MTVIKDRKTKMDIILEEYNKRKSQKKITEEFGMSRTHVSWVTQKNNIYHTLNINEDNPTGQPLKPEYCADDFNFLDKYPIENFQKK